ncbi:hypothetical protein LC087_02170 [Bacillus carboniphilus]|uniref:YitT family protein n=1 Tax=Bacillus carboniphilus TaxID=86663 RepID=A0ABY9JUG6_9BACI|nr:hypothetical protein [Bacillus carboniphilus]WLR43046.1 hypothetical protein LC087_02170 [Bacillus carboniphilus]
MKRRLLFFSVGVLILTMGVALIIKSSLGASAWDSLAVSEYSLFGLTIGTFVFINGIGLIFINALLLNERPRFLEALTILLIGKLIDFWLFVFGGLNPSTFPLQWATIIAGILTLGMGIAIYLQAKFPASPMDTLMVAVQTRFKLNLLQSRLISEGFALTLAFILGGLPAGAIGIGTIVVTLTLGFVVQFSFPIFAKLMEGAPTPTTK